MTLLDWALGVPEFVSLGTFKITGRGTVFLVPCPSKIVYGSLLKTGAIVDGVKYNVIGIEKSGYNPYELSKRLGSIGILVKEWKD